MSDHSYVFTARDLKGKGADARFIAEPGDIRFLKVPVQYKAGKLQAGYSPRHVIPGSQWFEEVADLADGLKDATLERPGHVLVFVHGYNNDIDIVHKRQVQLQQDLAAEGFHGLVVAFDWPSDDSTLNYLEDRWDAAEVALKLVTHGIEPLAARQRAGCDINVHLLGHSTGAFVIMEAFAAAQKSKKLFKSDWRVAQVGFIGGDVSRDSLSASSDWAQPLYSRVMRLTNYSNGFDDVLAVSNAKRLGVSPRAGRVGLPSPPHAKSVNVDCGPFFRELDPDDQPAFGTFCHSWHIGNPVFARDLALTLEGRIDRRDIPTRRMDATRGLVLQDAPRPEQEAGWLAERADEVRRPR
jgi:pimeloyl-ACP methyl ester carboxylesterase